jgi:hypothetical protein
MTGTSEAEVRYSEMAEPTKGQLSAVGGFPMSVITAFQRSGSKIIKFKRILPRRNP